MDYLNIDKLQRVNKLAKELKGHGLVGDMTDAYLSAKSMADSGNELSFLQRSFAESQATNAAGAVASQPLQDSFLKVAAVHQPAPAAAPHVAHSGAHPVQQPSQVYDSGDSDKLIALKNRLAEAEQRIVSMEDVFMKVQHVINDLINQVNDLKKAKPAAAPAPAPQRRDAPLDPKVQEHIEAPPRGAVEIKGNVRGESNGQEHPRQGKYTSEDVSIDKFFYFGNK